MENQSKHKKMKEIFLNYAIYFVLVLLFIGIVIKEPRFIEIRNFVIILKQASTRIIFALGVGGIIVTKGTDLSLGRQVGLAAVVSASLLQDVNYQFRMYPNLPEIPVILPILLVMVLLMFFSGLNGVIVAKLKVDPFIATLGSSVVIYGITSLYFDRPPLGATPIGSLNESFRNIATGELKFFGIEIPYLIIIATLVTIIVWIMWNKTRFGKNMFAIGGNQEAARVSGVNVALYTILVYAFAGILYGLGGAIEAARIGTAASSTGFMYELDAISACIVGGLSFDGGIGKISGIVTGVLIFQVIAYGLNYIGVTPYIQFIVKGSIIILAVAIDSRKNAVKQ